MYIYCSPFLCFVLYFALQFIVSIVWVKDVMRNSFGSISNGLLCCFSSLLVTSCPMQSRKDSAPAGATLIS